MLIFNITTKPENYSAAPIKNTKAEVILRTKKYRFEDEEYNLVEITFPSTDEQGLTAYMKRFRGSYFVVEDEKLITPGLSGKFGKYLNINVVDKEIDNIKPFKYSGNKNLVFERGGWGSVYYDNEKKQIQINVKIDSSQLGTLPHNDLIEYLIIDEKDINKLVECGFLLFKDGDYKIINDNKSEFVITDINPELTFFVFLDYKDSLKLKCFGEVLKKSDFEAQEKKKEEEKARNKAIQSIKTELVKGPEIKSSELNNPN